MSGLGLEVTSSRGSGHLNSEKVGEWVVSKKARRQPKDISCGVATLQNFPEELLTEIGHYLDAVSVTQFSAGCKSFAVVKEIREARARDNLVDLLNLKGKRLPYELMHFPLKVEYALAQSLSFKKACLLPDTGAKTVHVSFCPTGRRFLTVNQMGSLHIWRQTNKGLWHKQLIGRKNSQCTKAEFSPNGTAVIAVERFDCRATLWTEDSSGIWRENRLIGHQGYVADAFFGSSDDCIFTTGVDSTVRIWRCQDEHWSGAVLHHVNGTVKQCLYNPNHHDLAVLSGDGSLIMWHGSNNEWQPTCLKTTANNSFSAIDRNTDGDEILAANINGSVVLWNRQTDDQWNCCTITELSKPILNVKFSPDARHFLLLTEQGTMSMFTRSMDGTQWIEKEFGSWSNERRLRNKVRISFSPDSSHVVVTGLTSLVTAKHSLENGWSLVPINDRDYELESATFAADGVNMIVVGDDRKLRIINRA